MAVVDTLEIQIVDNAKEAASNMDRLAQSMNRVGKAKSAPQALREVADETVHVAEGTRQSSERLGTLTERLKAVSNAFKNSFGKGAAESSKKMNSLSASFGRFLRYRAFSTGFRILSTAISEGTSNLYQWSKAVGGTFAKSMDLGAATSLKLKNSLAAALSPVISSLISLFAQLGSVIVWVLNLFNQFFSWLGGSKTYLAATDAAKDYTQAAGGAAAANKDLMTSFDELNVLQQPSGGGGGGAGIDPSKWFEKKDIVWWQAVLGGLATALAGFKIASSFLDDVRKLKDFFSNIKNSLDGIKASDISSKANDLSSVGDAAKSAADNLGDASDAISGIKDAVDVASGAKDAAKTLIDDVLGGIGSKAKLLLATLPAAIALIGGLSKLLSSGGENGNSSSNKTSGLSDNMKDLNDKANALQDELSTINTSLSDINESASASSKKYSDLFADLANRLEKTLKRLLASALSTVSDIYRDIAKLSALTQGEMLSIENAATRCADRVKAAALTCSNAVISTARSSSVACVSACGEVMSACENAFNAIRSGAISCTDAIRSASSSLAASCISDVGSVATASSSACVSIRSESISSLDAIRSSAYSLAMSCVSLSGSVASATGSVFNAIRSGAASAVAAAKSSLDAFIAEYNGKVITMTVRIVQNVSSVHGGGDSRSFDGTSDSAHGGGSARSFGDSSSKNWADNLWDKMYDIGNKVSNFFTHKASGGIVPSGQMFIARESGPELVGTMGGHTAVANNQQIVAGIYEGVKAAMQDAGSSNSGGTMSVNVYLDGKQITAAVEKRQRERGATIYPGGVLSGV